jgi:hypothetical protein
MLMIVFYWWTCEILGGIVMAGFCQTQLLAKRFLMGKSPFQGIVLYQGHRSQHCHMQRRRGISFTDEYAKAISREESTRRQESLQLSIEKGEEDN